LLWLNQGGRRRPSRRAAAAGVSFVRFSRSFVTPRYGVGAAIRGVDAVARYGAKRG